MNLRSLVAGLSLFAASAALPLSAAHALNILVDQINPFSNKIGPGGADWDTKFTNALAAQPGGYTIGQIANAADVAGAYAILVVVRNPFGGPDTLSAPEVANLTSFLASGGRVAIIGEGDFFANWNNSIVNFANSIAGGPAVSVGPMASGNTSPVVSNSLTQGVGQVTMQGAGVVNGGGGTSLFGTNFATLWTANLLTVLDMQPFRNLAPDGSGDAVFRDNLAGWLSDSALAPGETPLPASLPLFASGLGALGIFACRRKRKNAAAA